jgi:tetratricopeptide (TPR) repeat protein
VHAFSRPLLALVLLLLTTSSAQAVRVVSVTPLPHRQVQVCWHGDPDAEGYWVHGSEGVQDLFVRERSSGTICRAVNIFPVADCDMAVVLVQGGKETKDQWVFGGETLTFHFIASGYDGFAAPPLCSPSDQYPTIESSESMGPHDLRLTDITTANDSAPRVRINVGCPAHDPTSLSEIRKYEIYENILKADGSTATRTTSRESCPNDLVLSGAWGDRSTVTAAVIYYNSSDKKLVHSICTAPRVITYGGAVVGQPRLEAKGEATLSGTIEGRQADDVLLFVNPSEPYHLQEPDQTVQVKSGLFNATAELKRDVNRVYAVARRILQGNAAFSEPVELSIVRGRPKTIALAYLPSVELTTQLYVGGSAPPSSPVTITLMRGAEKAFQTTLHSCRSGQFASEMHLSNVPAGAYTLTASAPGVNENTTAPLHLGAIYPDPAMSLEAGAGPFAVNRDSVAIKGRITPRVETGFAESNFGKEDSALVRVAGTIYRIEATLNDKPVDATVEENGDFTVKASPLQRGANRLTLKAVAVATKQQSKPIEVTIQSGRSGVDPEEVQKLIATGWETLDKDPEGAAKAFTKITEMDPQASYGFTGRAAADIRRNDAKSAFEDASHAVELDPRDYRAWSYRANYFIQSQKYAEAIETVNRSIELDPTFQHPFDSRAEARLRLGQYAEAVMDATKAIEIDGQDAYAYRVRSEALDRLGEADRAAADLKKLVELDPEEASRQYNSRAWHEYKKGDFDQAIADGGKSIELKPNPWAYGTRAWARQAKGDAKGALDDLAQALQLETDYNGVDLDRGMAEYIRENWAQAIEWWEKGLAKDPSETEAVTPLLEKARQQLRKGK